MIDPVVEFATYLGGTLNDTARGVAVDSLGNASDSAFGQITVLACLP